MNKKIKDDMVAVLYSPRYGAGWYSWHGVEELLYDPKLVDMVEEKASVENIQLYCEEVYGTNHYYGGADNLEVMWVSVGTPFRVDEYGGAETIEIRDEINWMVA